MPVTVGRTATAELRWTPADGLEEYRVVVRDKTADRPLFETEPSPECRIEVDPTALPAGARVLAQVHGRTGRNGEWQPHGPPVRLVAPPAGKRLVWLGWSDLGADVYRLQVYDDTAARYSFDDAVAGTSWPLLWDEVEAGHDYRWRARPWTGDDWGEEDEWRALPREVVLGDRDEPPRPDPADLRMLLMFTIDTEAGVHRMRHPDPARAIDELVFGSYGGRGALGIGLHMDLLEHFGFRGCFFVDILLEYTFGREALDRVVAAIEERGHEVELHVHSNHLALADSPALRSLHRALLEDDPESFRRLMDVSVDLFERRVGRSPRAYRAGAYHLCDAYLEALPEFGIRFDSSLNIFQNARVSDWMLTRAQPFRVGEVLEIPVSWYLKGPSEGEAGSRVFAPNPTAGEPWTALGAAPGSEPLVSMYVAHSFSLTATSGPPEDPSELARWRGELAQRSSPELYRELSNPPLERLIYHEGTEDEHVIARLAAMLRRVAMRDDASCVTFSRLADIAGGWWGGPRASAVDPVAVWLDRAAVAGTSGARVYSESLLDHQVHTQALGEHPDDGLVEELLRSAPFDWRDAEALVAGPEPDTAEGILAGLGALVRRGELSRATVEPESCSAIVLADGQAVDLPEALDAARRALWPEGHLLLLTTTLGTPRRRCGLPPLAELLYPRKVVEERLGAELPPPWDVETYLALSRRAGFDVVNVLRFDRSAAVFDTLELHAAKLAAVAPAELRTGAVGLVLQRPLWPTAGTQNGRPAPLDWAEIEALWSPRTEDRVVLDLRDDAPERVAAMAPPGDLLLADGCPAAWTPAEVEPELDRAYAMLRAGGEMLTTVGPRGDGGWLSPSSAAACFLRAGFEVREARETEHLTAFRLLRPFERADLERSRR